MRHIADLQQEQLFDPFEHLLSRQARQSLQEGWQGVFRHAILELLPVDAVAEKFHPTIGRPTKELYSVAGLILILEFRNWTKEEAVEAYMFHSDVWYVLNMGPGQHGMSVRTLERYQRIFREEELAQSIMDDVTSRLVELLELDISKQRLDSTHVFSDMAAFGRTRMMGIAIKRFLTQVKRHDRAAYDALPEEIRARYRPSAHQLFGDTMKDKEKRALLLQQVAEDLHRLLEGFADNARVNNGQTFKLLRTIFEQQCEVVSPAIKVHAADSDTKVEETVVEETKVVIKTKTGGNVIQNPSDPDATYDAHKGAGYQVQLTQTCGENNEVQLITSALPQTACVSDADAPREVLDELERRGLLPDELLADTAYGSDENVQAGAARGVELVAPVPGKSPGEKTMGIGEFDVDPRRQTVQGCPAGHAPQSSVHDPETQTTRTQFDAATCAACPLKDRCPVKQTRNGARLDHTAKEHRLDERRKEEKTDDFRERYKKRAGIEGANSGLKRRTGLGRLPVRGKKSVFHAILLKVAGWNILQAARSTKIRGYVAEKMKKEARRGQESPRRAPNSRPRPHRWCWAALQAACNILLTAKKRTRSRNHCHQARSKIVLSGASCNALFATLRGGSAFFGPKGQRSFQPWATPRE
jgi:hypothetical protein